MTVSYNDKVATGSRGLGNFLKLLFRWRGSIYKLVLPDLILYLILYYGVNCTYRFYLSKLEKSNPWRTRFLLSITYCENVIHAIPLEFLLGFYISNIVSRWWNQYMSSPWPDSVAVITAIHLQGHDERARMMRRTLLRYVNLCILMTFSMISPQARKRFPDMSHMVAAGFLLPHEKRIIDGLNRKLEGPKYYVPIVWAAAIATKARKEGRIADDLSLYTIIKTLCVVRLGAGDLLSYDWICFPLVYTQVVTLAIYVYFGGYLMANQHFGEDERLLDLYVPIFDFLKFFFMMGWLKVGEVLINPFGEDDDDFEVNWLIDRNLQISYLIVDEINYNHPELQKDKFWETIVPEELYYTKDALKFKTSGYKGSAVQDEVEHPRNYEKEEDILHHEPSCHGHPSQDHLYHLPETVSSKDLFEHTYCPFTKDSDEELLNYTPSHAGDNSQTPSKTWDRDH